MEREPRQTLPELLFVVAGISLLLLAVAAGPVGELPAGADLLERVHVALQMARVEAVSRGTLCRVAIDPRSGHVTVLQDGDAVATILHDMPLPRGAALTWIGAGGEPSPGSAFEVAFDARGIPVDGPGEILVGSGAGLGAVELLPDGELRLSESPRSERHAGL